MPMKNVAVFNALGARIQELRIQKNLTVQDLAQAIGKDETEIIQLEAGQGNPWMTELFLITKTLDVSMAEFFKDFDMPLK
jgi:transcriptional regulator with XRE-family HTH domain